MVTTVTSKGQVTIPKPVRDRLGIEPGIAVEFELAPDRWIALVKVDPPVRPAGSIRVSGILWGVIFCTAP